MWSFKLFSDEHPFCYYPFTGLNCQSIDSCCVVAHIQWRFCSTRSLNTEKHSSLKNV